MARKIPDRPLTPEEKELWQELAGETKPLTKRERSTAQKLKTASKRAATPKALPDLPKTLRDMPELGKGSYIGIDRNKQERFRKGELEIDGRLDLHGKTREEARTKVMGFIKKHIHAGSRCLLIVTGKGTHKSEESSERGVLRDMLPGWINEPELRPYILAFDEAKPPHGGKGAWYVLLRRMR